MEIVALLFVIIFFSLGFFILSIGIYEVWEEEKFERTALTSVGKVVGNLGARHGTRSYSYGGGTHHTTESSAGTFLVFEYEVENGDVYQSKTKRPVKGNPSELTVLYNRNDPSDIMVNGFYKVGFGKYIRIVAGILWVLVFSLLLFF